MSTPSELPEKIRRLQVHVGADVGGELVRDSQYLFTYASDDANQPAVALLMPASRQLVSSSDPVASKSTIERSH